MSRSKVPSELTLEELLESVKGKEQQQPEEQAITIKDPFVSFIIAFNIKPGEELVSGHILFKLFKSWDKTSEFKVKGFNKQLGKIIPSIQHRNRTFYKVTNNVLDLAKVIEKNKEAPKSDRAKTRAWHVHYEKFLLSNNLKEGNVYLETDIFFYIYNRWCDTLKRDVRFSYQNFIAVCKLNFDLKKITKSPHYWVGLNEDVKNMITEEEVERWRQGRIRINGNRTKKEK